MYVGIAAKSVGSIQTLHFTNSGSSFYVGLIRILSDDVEMGVNAIALSDAQRCSFSVPQPPSPSPQNDKASSRTNVSLIAFGMPGM